MRVTERVPLAPRPNDHNIAYLRTKRDRMGHQLDGLDAYVASLADPHLREAALADEADLVVDPPRVDAVTHDPSGNATIPDVHADRPAHDLEGDRR